MLCSSVVWENKLVGHSQDYCVSERPSLRLQRIDTRAHIRTQPRTLTYTYKILVIYSESCLMLRENSY